MKLTSGERLAVIETEVKGLKVDVAEIKQMLKEHTEWEATKYDDLNKKFAGKWVERGLIAVGAGIGVWLFQQLIQLI